ncbi:5-formyltetrahydrofolate cyclo-ligase [Buchnera aphidicola (Hyalopterus amygdali)]
MRILRNSIDLTSKYDASKKILNIAFNYNVFYNAKNIGCFLPFDGEINTYPLILEMWKQKKNVFLPVINSFYLRQLIFVPFTPYSVLYYNKYNILEPFYDIPNIFSSSYLDLIIVPLVACDQTGIRLGMGGGFYDQFLKNWKIKNIIPIGLAYDFQIINYIPKEYWDIALPIVLTPKKIYFFN